ncbi:MAG: SPOR domain-containing protein [Prevotella sp.]|nr:SPOR domain-containing protein [Prevotella sp.]
MRKSMIFCAGFCVAMALSSCGAKESAYKKAYEKAKAQEQEAAYNRQHSDAPVVTPITERPASEARVVDNYDNVSVRTESVTLVNGSGIRNFSVVVGSFSVKANAEGLQQTLRSAGYDAQLAYSEGIRMYRVIASTHDNKSDAARSRDQFRGKYPDAWLLYNQK